MNKSILSLALLGAFVTTAAVNAEGTSTTSMKQEQFTAAVDDIHMDVETTASVTTGNTYSQTASSDLNPAEIEPAAGPATQSIFNDVEFGG